ncbi:MAG: InlB B-repeat-containing protein, partial [Opitutales bacterium]|nr:InlB B-repeat-containing protein [Opitutales bacterium]
DASPVLGQNNEVFFVSRDGYLRSVDTGTGITNWEGFTGDVFYSSPVVDSNGKVYVIGYTGFGENHLFAFNSNGTKSWDTNNSSSPLSIGGLVDSSLALDSNGNLFFGCYDNKVYAVNVGAGFADNPWPQFQRNNKRSGAWPSMAITVIIEPNGAGVVSGAGIYNPGATATLHVTSNTADGYNFSHWSNGQTGTSNPLVLPVSSDLTLTANFGLLTHNLVVNAGTGGTATGSGNIPHGTLKTITATPSTGYSFTGWSGTGITDSSSASTTVNMIEARTVTANFELNSYPLTVNATTGGTVTGSGNIPHGTLSAVSATPSDGYSFTVWSGNGISDPYSSSTTVNMNQVRTIKAHFSLNSYVLSLVSNEGGTTTGEGNFSYGSNASILATPSAGYSFSEWTGDSITNPFSASTTVSMEQNREITARFVPVYYSLSVNSSIGGIANGEGNFLHGSNASITATPATGYSFIGWTGEGISNSSANPTIVNMTQTRTATANFAINSYPLTLNSEENGTVDGEGLFTYNSFAPIHALPDPGFIFLSWHGGGVTDQNQSSTTVLMNQDRNLTASFTQGSEVSNYLNIRSQPINGGITSGAGNYSANENTSISASPLPGFSFYSWTGDGVTEPLSQTTTVQMSQDRNISAQFSQNYYNLFLTSSEGGTALGSGAFTYGINAIVTATPALGFSFEKWKGLGISSPNSATTTVEMTADRSVSALFSINSYNLTINHTTGGSVEGSGSHSFGSSPTILATPMQGYSFSSWSGNGVTNPASQTTSVQMNQDRNISALFTINSYDLTIQSSAGGSASGSGSFAFGTSPSIYAIPMQGYSFSSWSGEGVNNPISQNTSVIMNQDRNISASFTKLLFSSTLETSELGNGWFNNNWLGSFYQSDIWWCYHVDLGWIYPAAVTENSLWIWSPKIGWVWIDAEKYLDSFAWSANEENWLYFNFESISTLRFYSYNSDRWTTYSQIQNLDY